MTGNDAPPTEGGGAPERPPYPLELLADLHAGALDEPVAVELRRRLQNDQDAQATLAALDATRAALGSLPPLRMPDDVAARIDAAAAGRAAATPDAHGYGAAGPAGGGPAGGGPAGRGAEAPGAPVVDLAAARARRRRGLIAGAGLLTAAAAVVGVIAVANLTGGGRTPGEPVASATNPSDQVLPPLAVSQDNLGGALDDAMATQDYGPLGAAGRLDACLAAVRLDPSTTPLGAREVNLDGKPGVLLILPTGTAARFRLLVVSPECGPGQPTVLADTTVGR